MLDSIGEAQGSLVDAKPKISTFVFFDTETTGLPNLENNTTRITELSMVAVHREHIIEQNTFIKSQENVSMHPRVINKLTLCLYPGKMISSVASEVTGLTNELLQNQGRFSQEVVGILNNFLKVLPGPVCIVAHNGHGFDFPILKNHYEKINQNFPDNILFVDYMYGLYDILEQEKQNKSCTTTENENDQKDVQSTSTVVVTDAICESDDNQEKFQPLINMQAVNECTPKKNKLALSRPLPGKKRSIFYQERPKPTSSYKLLDIHKIIVGENSERNAHRAEEDCLLMLEIAVHLGEKILNWCDQNSCTMNDINAMTPGLLLLTGVFWGCTNPFIRQGTKGLRDVRATTRLGQVWAELTFLLGNWKYVVPWLINQAGSLVYLAAVQRAPLSIAVPTANSAAFALTALTGAAVGTEQPLDAGSIVGIVCIVTGTALCCWDKTD